MGIQNILFVGSYAREEVKEIKEQTQATNEEVKATKEEVKESKKQTGLLSVLPAILRERFIYGKGKSSKSRTQKIVFQGGGGGGSSTEPNPLVRNPRGFTFLLMVLYFFATIVFKFLPFDWVFFIFGSFAVYSILSWKLGHFIITVLIFSLVYAATTEDIRLILQTKFESARENFDIKNPISSFKELLYPSWDNPNIAETEPQKGIQFLSFEASDTFQEGKPARLDAKIKIDGFYNPNMQTYEDPTVSFSCYEEDRDGKRVQEGEVYVNDQSGNLNVPKKATSTHFVSCRFPKGLKFHVLQTPFNWQGILDRGEGTEVGNRLYMKKRIVIEAQTRMLQVAGLKLWTVQEAEAPDDILQVPSVKNDPTFDKSDETSIPQCKRGCNGPYLLTMGTGKMPLTESNYPNLRVGFVKNELRFGTIARLNSLQLTYPESLGVEFYTTQERSACDFTGGQAMTLREDRLEAVNAYLLQLFNLNTAAQDQITIPLSFQCEYRVTQPPEHLGAYELTARADYDVVIRKSGLADIYREKELAGVNALA